MADTQTYLIKMLITYSYRNVIYRISNWRWFGYLAGACLQYHVYHYLAGACYVSPHFCGETLFLSCPSVHLSVTQFVSATPLKLLNRISWNLVVSKDTICSCAYYQEILIPWILWELCPFELSKFPKYTSEAACQRNSSETTEQNFMKLGR